MPRTAGRCDATLRLATATVPKPGVRTSDGILKAGIRHAHHDAGEEPVAELVSQHPKPGEVLAAASSRRFANGYPSFCETGIRRLGGRLTEGRDLARFPGDERSMHKHPWKVCSCT